ncbi:MAG: aminotransferase class I/II-fold pyridoxal phosphate-dependent enzyme [Promethearchaeia archaeon]
MKELNRKVKQAPRSQIRELFDLAAGRSNVISLGIGQPDFDTPEPAIQGNIEALKSGITTYAPTKGVPELLQLVENKLETTNNINCDWEQNIIITNGGSQAITLAYASIFNPGDDLLLFSPNFLSYYYCSLFYGVKTIEIERNHDFSPNIEQLKSSITENTKALLINSPNNPTGYAFNKEELKILVDIVKDNDLYLITDEVYENYYYDRLEHLSPASLDGMFDRTITVNAMSKLYSATGFRLGYAVARKEILDLMEKYHQYTVAGTNHAAQYGFIEALKMDTSFFDDIVQRYEERRDFVYQRLKEMDFDVIRPRGAFYIMPSVKKFGITGAEFSEKLMKSKAVAVVPGEIFGSSAEDRIRVSYALEKPKLAEAMDRIESFIQSL